MNQKGPVEYRIGPLIITLTVDPRIVFPPSETSIALAEVMLSVRVESLLDMGTGSGLLAIVASKCGCNDVWAIDKNPRAVRCASENASQNGVADRIHCVAADIQTWHPDFKFEVVVSNPPFMPMPPHEAFVSSEIDLSIRGGTDGTEMLVAFAQRAVAFLRADGRFIFGLPHFVNHSRVTSELASLYSMTVVRTETIRYWLAEYNDTFSRHVRHLADNGVAEVFGEGKVLRSTLSIYECRLR